MKTKQQLVEDYVSKVEEVERIKTQLANSCDDRHKLSNEIIDCKDLMAAVVAGGIECHFGSLLTYNDHADALEVRKVTNSYNFNTPVDGGDNDK